MGQACTRGPLFRVSVEFAHSMEEAASALTLWLHPFLSPSQLCSLAEARLLGPLSRVVMPAHFPRFFIAVGVRRNRHIYYAQIKLQPLVCRLCNAGSCR